MSNGLAGMAAVGAGCLDRACVLLEPTVNALAGTTVGWGYRYRLPYTIALGMLGRVAEAAASLAALENQRHPSWQYLDYELALARAWVAAAGGAVNEATGIVRSAAETAHGNGQYAAEVVCLQTATQFGDYTTAPRLRELQTIVEGPRVAAAARFADALRNGDAAELEAVSFTFEKFEDRIAAIDAAARAALRYRSQGKRGSALRCSSRAEALAQRCGSARTPALLPAAVPLPLTDREREIVMLLRQGLTTREVAERLTLSVRTVEGHIYRAMAKTGAVTRDDLTSLLEPR
jgi:DNA-binding CsgD family transcriptional regulator